MAALDLNGFGRGSWAGTDPLYIAYHDVEWGAPVHDDRTLFELLILEGAQAGLSWLTILKKRETYRMAFDNFDAEKVALYGDMEIDQLLQNAGIVRNRLKLKAAVRNAEAFLRVQDKFTTFDRYIWRFVENKTLQNKWTAGDGVPARTAQSDQMSKDLLQNGFTFVGTTICYAFMQSAGMVNDHVVTCFRHKQLC